MASASDTLSLCKILSESKRIIRANLHHFQALTALFILPLSLCLVIYPIIFQPTLPSPSESTKSPNQYLVTTLFSIFVSLLSLCAFATISYSTYNGFYGEPVSLMASIKSLFSSFLPLLSTTLVTEFVTVLIFIPSMLLLLLVYKWLHGHFLTFLIFTILVYIVLLMHLQVSWLLAYAVVVVENKWGYEALKRSVYLVKGNRGVALSSVLYFGVITGLFYFAFYGIELRSWAFLVYMIFGSFYLSLFLLLNFVGIVVLYVYCRDLHEGLPLENTKNWPLLK
ncbi:hypothetical protein ACH5RR_036434 [Cinchona calisaya]|uniref:Transmembrane protein n=1 Tax=Cinchona calisaya TaxID=153742 RepID=A0ABD2Y841_9GENT